MKAPPELFLLLCLSLILSREENPGLKMLFSALCAQAILSICWRLGFS